MITKYNYMTNSELLRLVPHDADPLMLELAQRVPDTNARPERMSKFAVDLAPEQLYREID